MKTNRQLAEDIMAGRDPKWGRFYTEGNTQEKQAAYQEVMRLLNDANKPVVEDDELLKLRESVRRLVGEWREQADERGNLHKGVRDCADELSALIDGKDEPELPKEPIKYTGHPYCHKCGKSHWMYAECETTNPRER